MSECGQLRILFTQKKKSDKTSWIKMNMWWYARAGIRNEHICKMVEVYPIEDKMRNNQFWHHKLSADTYTDTVPCNIISLRKVKKKLSSLSHLCLIVTAKENPCEHKTKSSQKTY